MSFFHTVYAALTRVTGVTHLHLSFSSETPPSYLTGLGRCAFPHLRQLGLEVELTDSVLNFMRRNSQHIRELIINPHGSIGRMAPICTFPNLICYRGNSRMIPPLLRGSPVQIIFTSFFETEDEDEDTEDDMEFALRVLHKTNAPVSLIYIMTNHWSLFFFECLSQYANKVTEIEYSNIDEDGEDEEELTEIISVRQTHV